MYRVVKVFAALQISSTFAFLSHLIQIKQVLILDKDNHHECETSFQIMISLKPT